MMSLTGLPLSFWGYALETTAFTLNRVASKSVETTPYELWFGKKPKLSFLKVWGCDDDTSILHHVFLLLFIMFLCIIVPPRNLDLEKLCQTTYSAQLQTS